MYIKKDPIHNKTLTTNIYAFTKQMYVVLLSLNNIMYIVPNQPKKFIFKYVCVADYLFICSLLKCVVL